MKIRKFNESKDILDIDTLLNILWDVKDELDWVDIVVCSATGNCYFMEDMDALDKAHFKFTFDTHRHFSFNIQSSKKDYKYLLKILNTMSPFIESLNNFGWTLSGIPTNIVFDEESDPRMNIYFKFKPV